MHDHSPSAASLAATLAFLSGAVSAAIGERFVSAVIGLVFSLVGTAIYQLGHRAITVAGEVLERRARRRLLPPPSDAAPGRPGTSSDA